MKRMIRATSTRDKISGLQKKIDRLRDRLADPDVDEDERIDLGLELSEAEEQLNFAWQDDEAEYNYALQQQEFNPDGSLKYYDDEVEAATEFSNRRVSQVSFDFVHDGTYDYRELQDAIFDALSSAGVEPIAVDFRSVDYSMYKEYAGMTVAQGGADFEWDGDSTYFEEAIEDEIASALDYIGCELIGISFNSLED